MRRGPQLPPSGRPGEQLHLIELPPFAPSWPSRGTLADAALARFLAGDRLDHRDFLNARGSWRLAAVVFELRALGWPIEAETLAAPTDENPARCIARYWLPAALAARARAALKGTAR
ncbi:MAG TPA: hypothetical protein PKJ45_00070 [Rubrivivax sp.]|nr:hypothetical protein [Rubrivivax sp.]